MTTLQGSDGPLLMVCPTCFARAGQPCNAPTDTGRRDVRWYHLKRMEARHDEQLDDLRASLEHPLSSQAWWLAMARDGSVS